MSIVRLIDSIITFCIPFADFAVRPGPRLFHVRTFSRRRSLPTGVVNVAKVITIFLCFLPLMLLKQKEGRRTCGSEDSLIDVNQACFRKSVSSFTHLKINVSVLIHVECSEDVIAELLSVPGREEHLVPVCR